MPLVFGDEVITKYLKFNAKERIWSFNNSDGEVVEIEPPKLLMDLHNIQTGWFCFREAQAPDIALDPPGTEAEEPEGGNHKRGFKLKVYSTALGVREMSSNSLMMKLAFKKLYDDYEEANGQVSGKLPLVEVRDHTAVQGKYGTNWRPEFSIVGWHDRPAEFPANGSNGRLAQKQPAAPSAKADVFDDKIPF